MNSTSAISTYNKVGLESGAMAADPHKLILMLYQGALIAITNAKNETLRKSISHAIAIIGEGLHASLDKSIGGEMTRNLASLYDYMVMRLVAANLKNDIGILDEVTRLLTELEEAWESIRPNAAKPTTQHKPAANVQLVYARG
jgi:flagellar protein FliS